MNVTLHSHHTPSLLLSNEVRSTPWPGNIWDTSDQRRFFGGYNIYIYTITRNRNGCKSNRNVWRAFRYAVARRRKQDLRNQRFVLELLQAS